MSKGQLPRRSKATVSTGLREHGSHEPVCPRHGRAGPENTTPLRGDLRITADLSASSASQSRSNRPEGAVMTTAIAESPGVFDADLPALDYHDLSDPNQAHAQLADVRTQ